MKQDTAICVHGRRHILLLAACLFLSPLLSFGAPGAGTASHVTQQSDVYQLQGNVTTRNGEPVVGAVVKANNKAGAITDAEGNFTLRVTRGQVIEVSSIGFVTRTLTANGQTSVSITLDEDAKSLDEVVVVGYGSMSRRDVTSSITTIKAKDMNVGVYSSPAQLLEGKVSGLTITQNNNPNGTPSITLRGASTFRTGAAQEPYYVVDGIPGVPLSVVAPDDIESIDVLRDASATAIYGSKAANGVIIVTTKKGRRGDHATVNYSAYVAVDDVAKRYEMLTGTEYRNFMNENKLAIDPNDEGNVDTDWQEEVQRTGFSQNHNLAISGGSARTSYSASFNIFSNNGVIRGTDSKRYLGRAFVETKALANRLTLSFNLNGSLTKQNDVPHLPDAMSVYDAMTYFLPISPVKSADGKWFERPSRSQYYNPVGLYRESINETKLKSMQAVAKATVDIIDGLNFNLNLSYQNQHYTYNTYYSSGSYIKAGAQGYARRASVENDHKTMELFFNYNKTIGKVHKLGAMLGYSWEEGNDNDGFQATGSHFFDDTLTYHNIGLSNSQDRIDYGNYYLSTLRMISFFGRVNYAYADRYLLQATVRRDGSSAFGHNNRWATFPSVSAAWRLSEEPFIKRLGVFNDLKFRVGYGVSGNSLGFDVFTATQVYGALGGWTTNSDNRPIQTIGATRNANPDLKWERTGMFNIGIDFGFLANRLNGTLEFYHKTTNDLIADYQVSTTKYLYNWLTTNVGRISNRGVELTVNAIPVRTGNFTWSTSLNISHNKNKVEKISSAEFSVKFMDEAYLGGYGQTGMPSQRISEGEPIGTFYGWKWAGYNDEGVSVFYEYDDEGKPTGNTTSKPQYKDLVKLGCAQPKLTYGWNNTLVYGRWTLTAFMHGVLGNKIMNATRARLSNMGDAGLRNILKSALAENKVTDINSHYLSDRYLESGSYLRLSTLSVAYDFGRIGTPINNLRLQVTCNYLFCITSYKGLDPEVGLGGIEPGIDNRQTYPRTRTFLLGVNINF